MTVRITCRNKMEIQSSLSNVIEKKCVKLKKFFRKVEQIDVIFSEEKFRKRAEIIVKADPIFVSASVESADEGAAFDLALKAVEQQIKSRKVKMIDRKKRAPKPAHRRSAPGEEEVAED